MRITGLATGLDMDEIVKNSMKPFRIKIDQMTQKRDSVELRQKLYRDIIKENRDFFDKHLDIAKNDSLLKQSNWSSVTFTSSDESIVTAKASGEAVKDNYKISVSELATKATGKIEKSDLLEGSEINLEGVKIKITADHVKNPKLLARELNEKLETKDKKNITVKYSEITEGLIFESKETGAKINNVENKFSLSINGKNIVVKEGKDSVITINGKILQTSSNTLVKDGITFNFNDITCQLDSSGQIIPNTDKPVKLTGKTDVKELKDKIVAFVNDYNKLIEKMNSTINTKHDRNYNPLTAEQKKDMSESDVKLWNERVEKGQLYRDSDITRVVSSMKDTMRTFMEDSGLKLESIGIKPVGDYSGNLNGTFTIDEKKLTDALENNTEKVMKLFSTPSPTEDELRGKSDLEKQKMKAQTGILFKLKNIVNDEFEKSVSSPLLKKAGFDGTTTFSTNDLSKSITDYEKRIKDMEKDFSRREQLLYSKYATLEEMMNKLNSQQSNLMSQLGMS